MKDKQEKCEFCGEIDVDCRCLHSPLQAKVEIKLTLKVLPGDVDSVSEELLKLVKSLGVFDGGKLE